MHHNGITENTKWFADMNLSDYGEVLESKSATNVIFNAQKSYADFKKQFDSSYSVSSEDDFEEF